MTDSNRPRIGITSWDDVPEEALARYSARAEDAGADIVIIDERALRDLPGVTATLDGLMLTGGIDVDPARYGTERHPKVKETSPERDAMEIEVLDRALARDIPVLAICRGHQLMNVAFGGSLLQHVESGEHRADYRTEGYPSRWHRVSLRRDSRLGEVFGATDFEINSRHHQAVRASDLAVGLRPVAFAADDDDQLIEGAESEQHTWALSVQWHPERLEEHKPEFAPLMRRLFHAFVARAAGAPSTTRAAAR